MVINISMTLGKRFEIEYEELLVLHEIFCNKLFTLIKFLLFTCFNIILDILKTILVINIAV